MPSDSPIEISQHNDVYFASNFIIWLRKKQNYYINLSFFFLTRYKFELYLGY